MAVSATEVQNAYTVPVDGVLGALKYYDQLRAGARAQSLALQQQKQARDYKNAKLIEQNFNGLDIGTGTPYDIIGQERVARAQQNLMSYVAANPNVNPMDLQMEAYRQTNGLKGDIDNAKKIYSNIQADAKRINSEFPYTDPVKTAQALSQKAFYNPDGSLRQTIDPSVNYLDGIYDRQSMAQISNPLQLREYVSNDLQKRYAPVESTVPEIGPDGRATGIDVVYKTRGFEDFDPKTKTASIKNAPIKLEQETGLPPGTIAGTSVPVTNKKETKTFDALPEDVHASLMSSPAFDQAVYQKTKDLKKDKSYSGVSDNDLERIASRQVVSQYSSGQGSGIVKLDPTRMNQERSDRRLDMSIQQQARSNSLAERRLAQSEKHFQTNLQLKKDKQGKAQADYVPNVLARAFTKTEDGKLAYPEDAARVKANTHVLKIGSMDLPGAQKINGIQGTIYKEPSSQRPSNFYMVNDPIAGPLAVYEFLKYDKDAKSYSPVGGPQGYRVVGNKSGYGIDFAGKVQKGKIQIEGGGVENALRELSPQFNKKLGSGFDSEIEDITEDDQP